MTRAFKPLDATQLKTYPLSERKSKTVLEDFARPWTKGSDFKTFLEGLPNILAGTDLIDVVSAVATAVSNQKTVVLGMGAHVIKVGLNRVVIDLMERGVVSALALNGAGIIHDLELAMSGKTSEDVDASLDQGQFGMVQDTCDYYNQVMEKWDSRAKGLGQWIGKSIVDSALLYRQESILAAGARLDIPVTVHVAMGTDILHMHPGFNPDRTGNATHADFKTFASVVATLENGVYLNVGSAVILPEIFLKAVTLVRNLGHPLNRFTTVNMDFIQHYRPTTNVVNRPTAKGGKGYTLIGHHEILVPLLAAGIIEQIDNAEPNP
ncbi:MAG: deoxyhypusine synthase family protein [Deltaproteobacteria bacterium]|nr:deoxyhypusine synthase family protein [Deltaproteobacteria bacterium]